MHATTFETFALLALAALAAAAPAPAAYNPEIDFGVPPADHRRTGVSWSYEGEEGPALW